MAEPAYVMGRLNVNRMNKGFDKISMKAQAGFRAGCSTIEHIFTLRKVLVLLVEWNTNLYVCFIDFKKAFDIVHKYTVLGIMSSYGIPQKDTGRLRALYGNCSYTVHGDEGTPLWFEVRSGVQQGCPISGLNSMVDEANRSG